MGVDDEVLPEDRDDREERPYEDPISRSVREGKSLPPIPASIIARTPPHDEDAEAGLLCAILLDPERIRDVTAVLAADDFYLTKNRTLYSLCLDMFHRGTPADAVLIKRELVVRHLLEEVGGVERLSALVSIQANPMLAPAYARAIADCASKREEIRIGTDLVREAYNGSVGLTLAEHVIEQLVAVRDSYASRSHAKVFKLLTPDKEGEQVDWLVRGYLARGCVTLLSALPKAGKSTLAYAIAAALQRGDAEFAGLACPEAVETIVMSEEPKSVLLETWKAVGLDPERVLCLCREDAFPMRPIAENVDLLLKAARPRKPKVGLAIVDPWRFWANLPPKAQNDAGAVTAAFLEIQRIASEGYAVLLLHHMRKAGGESGTAIADSGALLANVDVSMELGRFAKSDKQTMRTIVGMGRHQRIPPEKILDFRPAADGKAAEWVDMGDPEKVTERLDDERALRALVALNRWATWEEVLKHMKEEQRKGMKEDKLRPLLNRLHDRHQAQRVGGKRGEPYLYASLAVPLHQQAQSTPAGTPPFTPPSPPA